MEIAGLAEINGKFVQQNDARLPAEQFRQGFRAGRGVALVALAHALVTGLAGERASEFAPRRVGENAVVHAAPVGRIGVLTVERGDADFGLGDELRVHELGDIGDALHAIGGVGQRNEAVGFTAAVAGIQPEDAGGGAGIAGDSRQDVGEQVFKPLRWVGIGKKPCGNRVVGRCRATNDSGEVGGKIREINRAFEHVFPWFTRFKNRW